MIWSRSSDCARQSRNQKQRDDTSRRQTKVWRRAQFCCEYCGLPQSASIRILFHIEHIIPRKHGGVDSLNNLALACSHCNLHKGSDLTAIDPKSRRVIRIFDPRKDIWKRHFRISDFKVVSSTPVGRATVQLLKMNHPRRVDLRRALA